MKKIALFIALGFSVLMVNAQKEYGTVYSDHEAITKTRAFLAALVKGDKDAYLSFLADSVYSGINGPGKLRPKQSLANTMDWWKGIENLSIKDDSPATPDAVLYKNGELWVQDWLRIKGTHKATGINIDLAMHNLYRFNKDGKIAARYQYFDNRVFEEISNSESVKENGMVYINHPYIVTVRKMVNAFCAEDINAVKSFFAPTATFASIATPVGKEQDLETAMKDDLKTFAKYDNITMVQFGYPDCIHYAQGDQFVVYSWWSVSFTTKDGKKKSNIPLMLAHTFDKDGKIINEMEYLSSNQLQ